MKQPNARRIPSAEFDFQDWAGLAKQDPAAFEARRQQFIDNFIDSAPPRNQERLRRLQWRIDMERRRWPTPLGACIAIYNMMWESFAGEGGLAQALQGVQHPERRKAEPSARVLPFRRRAEDKAPSNHASE